MFRYKLHSPDGDDLGVDEEEESQCIGLLRAGRRFAIIPPGIT